ATSRALPRPAHRPGVRPGGLARASARGRAAAPLPAAPGAGPCGARPGPGGRPGPPSIVPHALKYAPMSEAENNVETETFRRLERLRELRIEHRDLDDVIHRLQMDLYVNEVQLRRLKKRKLMLKDQIARLESELIPDLNA